MGGERCKEKLFALAHVPLLVGASSRRLKGRRIESGSGHTPGLWVGSVGVCVQEATYQSFLH